jgi:serine/threonine-protein kinase
MLFCIDCGQPLQILTTLGQYSLIRSLPSGNITTTYLAWSAGQRYWLTTLNPPWLGQSGTIQQFERQGRPLLGLQQQGLPRYQGYFITDGQPYLLMNEVMGQDLQQRVKNRGPLDRPDAIAIILQVCDILTYLHQHDPAIVHESICPEYLVQFPPTVPSAPITLTGFASLRSWLPGEPLATEGYSAPEIYQGESFPASDLYSLGPTLIYLLTGTDPRIFYAEGEQGFRLYPEKIPNLPSDLIRILRCLTNPQPEDRYKTALEVATALKQLQIA